jgi:hypothetical protein
MIMKPITKSILINKLINRVTENSKQSFEKFAFFINRTIKKPANSNYPIKKTDFNLSLFKTFITCLVLASCSSAPLLGTIKPSPKTTGNVDQVYSKSTLGLCELSTFDVYVDKDIIHILAGGKASADGKQTALRYTRSEDGGREWIEPVILNDKFPATINSRGNDIQLAAKGETLLAAWQTKGELPGMGPMVSAYSQDKGKTWVQGSNPVANNSGDQSHLDVTADQQGRFHAIWLEDPEENGYQSLRYAQTDNNAKQWSTPNTLDDSTCSCCWNTIALSQDNELNILFRDMKPRDMALLQSQDAGKTWQRLSTVGEFNWQFDGCPHVGGGLIQSVSDKKLHSLVWTGVDQKAGLYYLASEDNGISWSTPKKMGEQAVHGDIATVDNTVAAIWDEMEAEGTAIFYSTSNNNGLTWNAPIRITDGKAVATHPRLMATKHGLVAFWTEKLNKQPSHLAWQFLE